MDNVNDFDNIPKSNSLLIGRNLYGANKENSVINVR